MRPEEQTSVWTTRRCATHEPQCPSVGPGPRDLGPDQPLPGAVALVSLSEREAEQWVTFFMFMLLCLMFGLYALWYLA